MKKLFSTILLLLVVSLSLKAQTCTVSNASPYNWVNPGPNCTEGGNAGSKTILVIPAGVTVNIGGADTWTGTRIEVNGTLNITADVTFNSSIIVKNGGLMNLNAKLFLGSTSGCGYGAGVQTGGTINVGGTGSDRLSICGVELMKGSGSCNPCGGTNSGQCAYDGRPYCEPSGGFTGPTGYGETGYDATLPITVSSFTAEVVGDKVQLNWITENEVNFDHFELERASSDFEFTSINTVSGIGSSSAITKYSVVDDNPLLGTTYYRLKAVDIDGSFEDFNAVSVDYHGGRSFQASPNPTSGSSIKYQINFEPLEGDQVILIDAVGNELQRGNVISTENELISNRPLPPGAYLLRYISIKHKEAVRVFIR